MRPLTKTQRDWLLSKDKTTTRAKVIIYLITFVFYSGFLCLFFFAYAPGEFYEPMPRLQNPAFFVFLSYFLLCLLCVIVVTITVVVLFLKDEKAIEQNDKFILLDSIDSVASIITIKHTISQRISKIWSDVCFWLVVAQLVMLGWFVWSFVFIVIWLMTFAAIGVIRYEACDMMSRCSPEEIREFDGDIQNEVTSAIIKELDASLGLKYETKVHRRKNATPLVEVLIASNKIPQSVIILECADDSLVVSECFYRNSGITHLNTQLSTPTCFDDVVEAITELSKRRQREAEE